MKSLIVFALMLCAVPTYAQTIDISNLPEDQRKELLDKVKKNTFSPPDAASMNEWAEWGQNMGVALAATAKELGVAVDDFSKTTVGKVTIAVIVYKIIGKEILKFMTGMFCLVVGICLWTYFYRRMCMFESISYHENGKKKEIVYGRPKTDAEHITRIIMAAILALICLLSNVLAFT